MKHNHHHERPDAYTRNVMHLCRKIDELEAENEALLTQLVQWKKDYWEISKLREQSIKESLGQTIALALNMREDGNGNLVIDNEGRKNILDTIKPTA